MSVARLSRDRKRQLGQFFTPSSTAEAIVRGLEILPSHRILEPSFGEGAFVFAIVEALAATQPAFDVAAWSKDHLFGCEIDRKAFETFTGKWMDARRGPLPVGIEHCDFFRWMPPNAERSAATNRQLYFSSPLETFDLVIGNPPFGGSIDPTIQDELDGIFGMRNSRKIKKETYAFFIVKCFDLLKPGGKLVFICSDTILTIPTMTGLRSLLQDRCTVDISRVPGSFSDTNQDMVVITLSKRNMDSRRVTVFGRELSLDEVESTPNASWQVNGELARYFTGIYVGDKMIASSGMTVGNND
ncbi:MAG: SAM-dependent DNA methyltransferase, partial [Planctomycetes bacterium]|nr:SAM-dependent DNA methyltransferase [Planctomycetota bacterium]